MDLLCNRIFIAMPSDEYQAANRILLAY